MGNERPPFRRRGHRRVKRQLEAVVGVGRQALDQQNLVGAYLDAASAAVEFRLADSLVDRKANCPQSNGLWPMRLEFTQ